MTYKKNKAN